MADASPRVIVYEGHLGLHRKKLVEKRYFVLLESRLEWFRSRDDAATGTNPLGNLELANIRRLATGSDGFVLKQHSTDQDVSLKALEGVDIQPWIEALQRLIEGRSSASSPARAKHGPRPAASYSSSREKKIVDLRVPRRRPKLVCEGDLDIVASLDSQGEQHYFVLYDTHFEYFRTQDDFALGGAQPQCRHPLSDVQGVEVLTTGLLEVQLANAGQILLQPCGSEGVWKWGQAWHRALQKCSATRGHIYVQWGDWFAGEGTSIVEEDAIESVDPGDPIYSGSFHHEAASGVVELKLYTDRLELFAGPEGPNAEPDGTIMKGDIDDIDIAETGVHMYTRDGEVFKLAFIAEDPEKDRDRWVEAFQQAFGGSVFIHSSLEGSAAATPDSNLSGRGMNASQLDEAGDEGSAHRVHEGMLDMGVFSQEWRHAILFNNRLEWFTEADKLAGCVWIADLTDIKLVDYGFRLRDKEGVVHNFRAAGQQQFTGWLCGWNKVMCTF